MVRGLGVHVDVGVPCRVLQAPRRRDGDGRYSPAFLRLVAGARGVLQSVLAVPSTVVRMYGTIPRDEYEWRKRGRLFVTQAMVSGLVFVMGNVVCAVAALPVSSLVLQRERDVWKGERKLTWTRISRGRWGSCMGRGLRGRTRACNESRLLV